MVWIKGARKLMRKIKINKFKKKSQNTRCGWSMLNMCPIYTPHHSLCVIFNKRNRMPANKKKQHTSEEKISGHEREREKEWIYVLA